MTGDKPPATNHQRHSGGKISGPQQLFPWLMPMLMILVFGLYLATLARHLVFGDPTEFTFVAHVLGIAHPPGYAFTTLMGKLFQMLIPFGTIPWRMHLLSAVAATLAVVFVYGTVQTIAIKTPLAPENHWGLDKIVALFAAFTVATAADWWQHAIHANPHIITATFLAANLFCLTKWWGSGGDGETRGWGDAEIVAGSDRWLYAFGLSAGLGITHHPLTVFSFLAYASFILWLRPSIWRDWRTLLKMAAFFLLGLLVWLYFPIRSAMRPVFGPDDMYSINGFLDHVLGRGITESLPFFGLADQLDRFTVFWTLLRLQYSLPIIFLSVLGMIWLVVSVDQRKRHSYRPLALLYGLALVSNYLFVINLRQQDIMAYLLGVFLLIGLLAGIGLWGLLNLLHRRMSLDIKAVALLVGALFLLGPLLQVVRNYSHISLKDYVDALEYQEAVFNWFQGQEEGAILLNDWEHMTPLWYARYVEGRWPDPIDVQPHLVSTDMPWLDSIYYYLPDNPVYLSGYRPEVAEAGFRLRPRGPFYQIVQPGDASIPPELTQIKPIGNEDLEIVALQLPEQEVEAGDLVPLTLAMISNAGTEEYYVPIIYMGEGEDRITFEFTTDGHLTTPSWEPGEVIVERFDIALPQNLPTGEYPLSADLRNLSKNTNAKLDLDIGKLVVSSEGRPPDTRGLLANFRQQVGLVSARVRKGLGQRRTPPWNNPILVNPGDTIHVKLEWESLAPADESYTVFLHLIDPSDRPLVTLDYTPLGGSAPTHLWIPKWLPGQRMTDPYRLEIPEDILPGEYLIEAGLYEMTGHRRLPISDSTGNLTGDRYILGKIIVQE